MRLYFLRHAIAEQYGLKEDAHRALTPDGMKKLEAITHKFPYWEVKPAAIYTSPLLRARQTADIVGRALDCGVFQTPLLAPGFNYDKLQTLLDEVEEDGDLMLVGHEPDFSTTISALMGGGEVVMKKAGLARVDVGQVTEEAPRLRGVLVWLLAPRVMLAD